MVTSRLVSLFLVEFSLYFSVLTSFLRLVTAYWRLLRLIALSFRLSFVFFDSFGELSALKRG